MANQDKKGSAALLVKPNKKKIAERHHVENEEKYTRGSSLNAKKMKAGYKLKEKIRKQEKEAKEAAQAAALAERLHGEEAGYLEAEGMEKTKNFKQDQLADAVDINTSSKIFNLDLDEFGPYALDYTRNGRHLLLGGKKGHIAAFDWQTSKLHFETHVKETVRDVTWLHNETMLAAAQKKYVFIYDNNGMEVHRMKNHIEVNKLEFLPYHFLLASVGNAGYLKYQDTSTGQLVAELRTKLGGCDTMTQNPWNAVINLGHGNGTVTMWAPTMTTPLVKMLCHKARVTAMAVDPSGRYMATAGLDNKLKVWDIRKYGLIQEYSTKAPAASLSISQRGLLAVGWNSQVTIWKDIFRTKQTAPYMQHLQAGSMMNDLEFCPFEDVLGVGHQKGMSSIVVPGAGEPNFDSLEANPYQTKKQRQEAEVHGLLDKLQPEMIMLDPTQIGKMTRATKEEAQKRQREDQAEQAAEADDLPTKDRKRMRGRNSSLKRYLRKKERRNIVDQDKLDTMDQLQKLQKDQAKPSSGFTTLDIF
ncbi:BING4CT-domain-containing protein [Hesseltinella vesiculosa]|uniref:U three protein 7 n=1 Tax=Hesseltinella vesiculosa TaxID=101127 RepID=A0A1X2GBB5_9FUNG|nr:BING4CT-domain-containing protein [Hesseltinella vesiculosa]